MMLKKITENQSKKLFLPMFFVLLSSIGQVFAAPTAVVCTTGSNLIVNGDAEADPTFTGDGTINHDVSGWEPETGEFTATKYRPFSFRLVPSNGIATLSNGDYETIGDHDLA